MDPFNLRNACSLFVRFQRYDLHNVLRKRIPSCSDFHWVCSIPKNCSLGYGFYFFFIFTSVKQIVFARLKNDCEFLVIVLNMAPEEGPNNPGRNIQTIRQQTKFQVLAESPVCIGTMIIVTRANFVLRAYHVSSPNYCYSWSNYFVSIISFNPNNNPMT